MSRPTVSTLAAGLLALACGLACGCDGSDAPDLDNKGLARIEKAYRHLTDNASDRVQYEVLRTCDKWERRGEACNDERVRIAQLECWLDEGMFHWLDTEQRRKGPWSQAQQILRMQNMCMMTRGWRRPQAPKVARGDAAGK